MGIVYEAIHLQLDPRVALKFVLGRAIVIATLWAGARRSTRCQQRRRGRSRQGPTNVPPRIWQPSRAPRMLSLPACSFE